MNYKAMKELDEFKAKRAAQLEASDKEIAKVDAEIELAKNAALEATAAGDVTAYSAALDKRTELERKAETLKAFRKNALESYSAKTDSFVMDLWEKYAAEYDKQISPKIKQLIKLRGELFAIYMEVLETQDEAFSDRGQFARCFSAESGIDSISARRTLPIKNTFSPDSWDDFRKVFAAELGNQKSETSKYVGMFSRTRSNI